RPTTAPRRKRPMMSPRAWAISRAPRTPAAGCRKPARSSRARLLRGRCHPELVLVALARSTTRNSGGALSEPLAHLPNGPVPLNGVGVTAVVFRPRDLQVAQELFPAHPRPTLAVPQSKGVEQPLRLIQPRGLRRGWAGAPPPPLAVPVVLRVPGGVAAVPLV